MKNGKVAFIISSLFLAVAFTAAQTDPLSTLPPQADYLQNGSLRNSTEVMHEKKNYMIRVRYVPFQYFDRSLQPAVNDCIEERHADFPKDVFTEEQRKHGAIIFHIFFGVYCFGILAIVCNDYFLPCVQAICDKMNLSQDVAAATVMAFATSAPELCVNLVGTFITKSDIGLGTIVGSAMFNTLGVAALGGLASAEYMKIARGPLTRDSIIYIITIVVLIIICWDEKVYWYETVILVFFYVCYFAFMWSHKYIERYIKKVVRKCRNIEKEEDGKNGRIEPNGISIIGHPTDTGVNSTHLLTVIPAETHRLSLVKDPVEVANDKILWQIPEGSRTSKFWFLFSWPIRFLLYYTIPDHQRWPCGITLTFTMCVFWIGLNSYLVSWMITIIGQTIGVADFVMGLTFLAAGGCLPEATSIVILSLRGEASMGVSNSLGANVQDILLALGLPWFIKSMSQLSDGVTYIPIGSGSLLYTIIALILAVVSLYAVIAMNNYKLNRKVGILLIVVYALFLTAAILMELLLVNANNLPECSR